MLLQKSRQIKGPAKEYSVYNQVFIRDKSGLPPTFSKFMLAVCSLGILVNDVLVMCAVIYSVVVLHIICVQNKMNNHTKPSVYFIINAMEVPGI